MLDNLKCIFCAVKVFQYSGLLSKLLMASKIILSMRKKKKGYLSYDDLCTKIIVIWVTGKFTVEQMAPDKVKNKPILKIGYCQLYAYWI